MYLLPFSFKKKKRKLVSYPLNFIYQLTDIFTIAPSPKHFGDLLYPKFQIQVGLRQPNMNLRELLQYI